jgi:hypothetical protein
VLSAGNSLYSEWRAQNRAGMLLGESEPPDPSERLLQTVWYHQRLLRDRLKTADGRPVSILHPGFWNRGPGPDFRNAVIQWADGSVRSGDIELDLESAGWRRHGHDKNPAFQKVILHVVWRAENAPVFPTLPLKESLDAPLEELAAWAGGDGAGGMPEAVKGRCCGPLEKLSAKQRRELLLEAAAARLRNKAEQLQARSRVAGVVPALWEGLFRALGYRNNVWPMQRLAELLGHIQPASDGARVGIAALQGRLIGLSGLLPADLLRKAPVVDEYLRRIWDGWWRERDRLDGLILPRTLWSLTGVRPANNPQRRLALAAHWLASGSLPERLDAWLAGALRLRDPRGALLEVLQGGPDPFWSFHWTFGSVRLPEAQPLLGAPRATDLAINVILPWMWMRARADGDGARLEQTERLYMEWPPAGDNAVLRLARQRLLGGEGPRCLRTAAEEQGLMQMVRDFCDHSNSLCDDCQFPALVRAFTAASTR